MKDTILSQKSTINCGGILLSLQHPVVMGIINATPDSFYDGGKTTAIKETLQLAEKHLKGGAKILDVGGASSRPGAEKISEVDEYARVIPKIRALAKEFPNTPISVDTYRSNIAIEAVANGAQIVNDISAGDNDTKMFETIAKLKVPYILMHMQNAPQNMQNAPQYEDVVKDISLFFSKKVGELTQLGINDLILDVGFGFGKTLEHNYELLKNLSHFKFFGLPILAGISRKSMLYKPLNITPIEALNATTAAHMIALQQGAKILRVHDALEAKQAIDIFHLSH